MTLRSFFAPDFRSRAFWLRFAVVALAVTVVFGFWLMPCLVIGESMLPTYRRTTFTFCNKLAYRNRMPEYGEVAVLKWSGDVYLLKRVVGLPGDVVEFRKGVLYRNGAAVDEPYVRLECDWELPARRIEPDHIYVVGDNRSMPLAEHRFGQIAKKRIIGRPLW